MRRPLLLAAQLPVLLVVVVAITTAGAPRTATALTIPLADNSTFVGTIDGVALGPGRSDGFPTGGSMGLITFENDRAALSSGTVQVTALHFSQIFAFGFECGGPICLPGFNTLTVSLDLEGPGSIEIDDEGAASGELHVIVGLEGHGDAAATLMVNVFGYPITPGALTLQGVLQFDNPGSPLADLQGVTLVPEPSTVVMLMMLLAASTGRRA
jgi:hypothetical protein